MVRLLQIVQLRSQRQMNQYLTPLWKWIPQEFDPEKPCVMEGALGFTDLESAAKNCVSKSTFTETPNGSAQTR